jgi:hypothetical protein
MGKSIFHGGTLFLAVSALSVSLSNSSQAKQNNFQVFIILMLSYGLLFAFGWMARQMKGVGVRRFKVKRRKYRVIPYSFYERR